MSVSTPDAFATGAGPSTTEWGGGGANRSELSPLRFLERSAAVFPPDRAAILYGQRRLTYAEFADHVQRLARVLATKIHSGDRVAYLAPPNIPPEMLIAHYAVPLAGGGVLVALNSRLAGPELVYILQHSGGAKASTSTRSSATPSPRSSVRCPRSRRSSRSPTPSSV